MDERSAYIVLNLIDGVGPIRFNSLISHFGSAAAVLEAGADDLMSVRGISSEIAAKILSWRKNSLYEKEISLAERAGVQIITRIDSAYPELLKEIPDAPICLYLRGTLDPKDKFMIGIVGSRRTTNYGRGMAEQLARSAVYAGWTVVSGLAFGIDAVAHRACIEANGKTIAVLGGGLARIFPQEHVALAKEIIAAGGGILSEFPMEFPPNKNSFPMRNRIISGLSQGVIVVEAGTNSGSLITAKFAIEQNRQLFAVPGQADQPQSRGTNKLIKEGAKLTESFDDILEEFEFLPGFRKNELLSDEKLISNNSTSEQQQELFDKLSNEEKQILEILRNEDCTADAIAVETGIDAGQLLAILMKLELMKLIVQLPGKRFAIKRR